MGWLDTDKDKDKDKVVGDEKGWKMKSSGEDLN